jgi:hypothetical protein
LINNIKFNQWHFETIQNASFDGIIAKETVMHTKKIVQDLLENGCPQIHAKRRKSLAAMADAGNRGKLSMIGISRTLDSGTSVRQRIKRCDRMLGNEHLAKELPLIYGAMVKPILAKIARPAIAIDWSDLQPDRQWQLLRAALVVKGRALVLYEEVHPLSKCANPTVHCKFMATLKMILPKQCRPVFITDSGFRAPWFKLLDRMGYAWVGRIRNRDMVHPADSDQPWQGCKYLYPRANNVPTDLGPFDYVRRNPVSCTLVLYKRIPKGRHQKTVRGVKAKSCHSLKKAKAQKEPWLLAASPQLSDMSAKSLVSLYAGRMQIEEAFRDTKNPALCRLVWNLTPAPVYASRTTGIILQS